MATTTTTPSPQAAPAQEQENVLFTQSYGVKVPKNMDGVKEIFTNPDGTLNEKAIVYTVRAGLKQIVNNRFRQKLTAKDEKGNPTFKIQDSIYDATALILEEPQRQVLSQRDKLKKNLEAANLPAAVIETMLGTYDQNVGQEDASGSNFSLDTNEARVVLGGKDGKQLVMKTGTPTDEDEE